MNYGYYQPNYYGLNNGVQNNQVQNVDERIWVQGIEGANAYLVAPNSFVRLWDSQSQVFYEKHTDSSGRPITETFEYNKIEPQNSLKNELDMKEYKSMLDDIERRLGALEERTKAGKKYEQSDRNDTSI